MRVHLITSKSNKIVPFNYQPMLTGALHKWLGKNNIHDELSLCSFSWLSGATALKQGLVFDKGASFFISGFEPEALKKIIKGIKSEPEIDNGLIVNEIILQETPGFLNEQIFYAASPILVKRNINHKDVHFTYDQIECDAYMTETIKRKLKFAGLPENKISIKFDRNFLGSKTKVIYYKNIGNRVNFCSVKIQGSPEQIAFAWNVGVGNSTGIGFGAIK